MYTPLISPGLTSTSYTEGKNSASQSSLSSFENDTGLKQISGTSNGKSNLCLGRLHTPLFGRFSIGNFVSTVGGSPGTALRFVGNKLTNFGEQQWKQKGEWSKQINPDAPCFGKGGVLGKIAGGVSLIVGKALNVVGNVISGSAQFVGGLICLGETLLTRAVYHCIGKDVSMDTRMKQKELPDRLAQDIPLPISHLHLPNGTH